MLLFLKHSDMSMRFAVLLSLVLTVSAFNNPFQWLTDDLFQDSQYDKELIPMEEPPKGNGANAVEIKLSVTPRTLALDDERNLKVNGMFYAVWNDYRLSWEPEEYEGIKKITVPSSKVWRPDIGIANQVGKNFLNVYNIMIT